MTSPKNERYIVWLHLSDLHHCQQKTGWDAHRVLDPLTQDLEKMETDHGLVPQLLFFTGDGAFGNFPGSTLPEQLDGVHALLDGARTAFSSAIPRENVFIVPGNHDVDRDEVTPDQTAWLTAQDRTTAEMTGLIQGAGRQWKNYVRRLAAYREFLGRRGYAHLLSDPERLIYSQAREIHGLKLGIAGFNSAWSCCRKGEKGQLWLAGNWQSGTLVQNLRNADVRLALTHHPFGWFVEQEDTPLRIRFEREFAFHLHGHEHLGWVNKSDDHVRVAAAACYESSWTENGYNFVRLDLETGEGEVWLRRYDAHGGGWAPRVIAGKTDNNGRWRLGQLSCLQKFARNKPVNKPLTDSPEPDQRSLVSPASNALSGLRWDLSRILKYAPAELIGREAETQILDAAWAQVQSGASNRPRVLTFVALGGEGKTSLIAHWAVKLSAQDWPGCAAAFAWSFYNQGTGDQSAASSDIFLKEALNSFGDDADQAFAASSAGSIEKGQRLAHVVSERKNLLVLDGLEPLQYAPGSPTAGELKDQGLVALLKGLAQYNRGLCLVTTRHSLPDLKAFRQTTAPEVALRRLPCAAGVDLLKKLGVRGAVREFEALVENVKGHALTLTLLGGFLHRAFGGDIRQRDRVRFEKADAKIDGGHALRTMAAYEHWLLRDGGEEGRRELAVLRLMGLFDRPADATCLAALRRELIPGLTEPLDGLADDDWAFCLSGLEAARLLTVNRDATGTLISLDAHPHLRAYFAQQLRETNAAAWRAAHRRLYEHLCASTSDQKDAPTLEDLQPLYQAVAHGCLAGLQQVACENVYNARILRSEEYYSARKLGAFGSDLGAVACFFEHPWRRVSPALSEADQTWLLNEAATRLRGLGRLTEALEPMRAGLEMGVKQEDWQNAAIDAGNLSELELTLGEVTGAVADSAQSVTYADRSDNAFQRMSKRTTHADALHQAGCWDEAEALFHEAERMQAERQPTYPLLYSVQSFRYSDLLLAAAERAAWRTALPVLAGVGVGGEGLVKACRAVSERAAQTLKWEEGMRGAPLLDFALHYLSLGRAALYEAILTAADVGRARSDVEQAVAGLRRAGVNDYLVRGLLTRAWLRSLLGACTGSDNAQTDLDEAWDIAERSSMRLFLADIHLHRARLFHAATPYPWDSPQADLAAARKLIEQCGYGRRLEELADAEAALGCA